MNPLTLLGIILIFYLPGYCICRLFTLKLKDFELVFFEVATSVLLSGLIAFVLAHLALFSIARLYISIAAVCIAAFIAKKPSFVPAPRKLILIACFAAAAASLFFLKPQEAFHGGLDPGVYLSTGINIANTGAILITSSTIQDIYNANLTSFYPLEPSSLPGSYGAQMPGFYIYNPEKGIIMPQFYHLYPVWIAIFYPLFGLKGTLFVAPFFSLLSLLAIFFFVKRTFSTQVAILSIGLLAINFAYVWHSLVANSEIMMLFFLFFAFYSLHLHTQQHIPAAGIWCAFATASGLLTRIEFIIIAPLIVVYLLYQRFVDKKISLKYFFIPFAILFGYAVVAMLTLSQYYTHFIIKTLFLVKIDFNLPLLKMNFWPIIIAFVCLFYFIKLITTKKIETSYKQKIILSLAFWLVTVFFYLLPHKILPGITNNLTTISWYVTPLGFLIGILGLLIMPWNKNKSILPLLALFVFFLSIYAIKAAITPVHPWWARRFLPVVFPALIIGISYFIINNRIFTNKLLKRVFAGLLTAVIALFFIFATAKIFTTHEFDGLTDILTELNQNITEPAVLVYSNDENAHKYAAPLHYMYGKEVLLVSTFDDTIPAYLTARAQEQNVYLLMPTRGVMRFFEQNFTLKPVHYKVAKWDSISRLPEWNPHFYGMYYQPDKIYYHRHDISLYQLQPRK